MERFIYSIAKELCRNYFEPRSTPGIIYQPLYAQSGDNKRCLIGYEGDVFNSSYQEIIYDCSTLNVWNMIEDDGDIRIITSPSYCNAYVQVLKCKE